MADLSNQPIDWSKQTDNMTSLGTAFFAGLSVGRCHYVTNNEFIVQLVADLSNQPIDQSKQTDNMTSLGTAFFAGLAVGRCHYVTMDS